ncbi:MAG: hypothetical protein EOL98_08825 [Negativicutes bacterium]|nr:hypothetical protein [Negativicutes bacterium]
MRFLSSFCPQFKILLVLLNDQRLYDTLNSDISLTEKANKDEDVLTKDIAETDQINVVEHEELNMDHREGNISDKN